MAVLAATNRMSSPDGRLVVTVGDEGGRVYYSVSYDSKMMIERSALGLNTNIGDFSTALVQTSVDSSRVENTYTMHNAKVSQISYEARQLRVTYANAARVRNALLERLCLRKDRQMLWLSLGNGTSCKC